MPGFILVMSENVLLRLDIYRCIFGSSIGHCWPHILFNKQQPLSMRYKMYNYIACSMTMGVYSVSTLI